MRFFGDYKGDQGQAHADEDYFIVADFAGGGTDHELVQGVIARGHVWPVDGNCGQVKAPAELARAGQASRLSHGLCNIDYASYRLIADFLGSAMVSNGSRAPSFGTIHFFSLAIISSSSFLSSSLGKKSPSCW